MYDPQLGRWHTMDRLVEKDYSWTPYRYGYDNPIRYWDVGGDFEMDPAQAQLYKRLAIFLQNEMINVGSCQNIVNGLMKYGSLSESQIKNDLTWGQGPKIIITDIKSEFDEDAYGLFNPATNMLYINKKEVEEFEKTGKIDPGFLAMLTIFILHEYVHYGDNLAGNIYKGGELGEEGEDFELEVFGDWMRPRNYEFFFKI